LKTDKRELADWGFKTPDNGWYLVEYDADGYRINTKDKDDNDIENKDNHAIKMPSKIKEGKFANSILSKDCGLGWDNTPEDIAGIIYATGLGEKFDEKFADFDSHEELVKKSPKKLLAFLASNLPGKQVYMKNVLNKKGYTNVQAILSKADFQEDVVEAGLLDKDKPKAAADDDGDWEG